MKVVLPAVLVLEAVVVALSIPVAITVWGRGAGAGAVLGVLALLLLLGSGIVRRSGGVWFGWVLQGLVILSGLIVTPMAILGALFLGVWVVGVIYGAKGDAAAARNAEAERQWAAEQAARADDPVEGGDASDPDAGPAPEAAERG